MIPNQKNVSHLYTLINADNFSAGITVFGEHAVETGEAVGSSLPHDVTLAPQLPVALEAGKVKHVPSTALSLGTLIGQNDLERLRNN